MRFTRRDIAVTALIAVAAFVAWYIAARPLALIVDSVSTRPLSSSSHARIGWNGSYLLIDSEVLDNEDPDNRIALNLRVDSSGRLVATAHGKSLALGRRDGIVANANEKDPAYVAGPGDRIVFTRAKSWLIWPTWFDFNFVTGHSPSWKRFSTYRLVWKKPSGATLDLTWRFEDWYYPDFDGWTGADMIGENSCGLVRVEIEGPR
jgi:hypothetical protein